MNQATEEIQDSRSQYYSELEKLVDYYESVSKGKVKDLFPAMNWALNHHMNTRGERMNFKDLPYLYELYKIASYPHIVVEKSVQVGLSELFVIQAHLEAGEYGWTVMYVLPKYEMRNRFVNNRLYKLYNKAPRYHYMLQMAETKVVRTSLVHFGRGTLVFVGSNVGTEFLEIPVDSVFIDEKDHCNATNLLMVPDRLSASPFKYHREISNPTVEGFGIDERYQESSQAEWHIRCEHCGKMFVPDFFRHVVREKGHNLYEARDPDYEPRGRHDARIVHDCGKPVENRLKDGVWVHKYPDRLWQGFRINKVYSKFTPLSGLIEKWQKSVGNDKKMQIFYNSDLGLPFSSKGARITRRMLNDCCRKYRWPVRKVDSNRVRIMGVDVGEDLHVILRERFKFNGLLTTRLLIATAVPDFQHVENMIKEWRPKLCVIDATPEIHKVLELKRSQGCVWSSRFQEGITKITVHKNDRELRMDRTALLDYVKEGADNQLAWLPMEAEFIDDGEYYRQMRASTRILEADEERPEKSRYVWVHSRPDHYFLAEGYCLQGGMMMPDSDVFEFFTSETQNMGRRVAEQEVPVDEISREDKEKIAEKEKLTPDIVTGGFQKQYAQREGPIKPSVDWKKIGLAIQENNDIHGYVDAFLVAEQVGESADHVKRVLKQRGFKESRIKGQYTNRK